MKNRPFGPTGESLPEIGLGGMPMSITGRPDETQSIATIHAALDAGMRLLDTADVYCLDQRDIGHNERLLAKAVAGWGGDRTSVRLATKGGLERPDGAWTTNGRPEHLRRACEASLRALGAERIWLYQHHAPDPEVPFADSIGALAELRAAGKITHVGLSNVTRAELDEARAIVPIASVQNRCNVLDRRSFEGGVVSRCEELGIAFLPYSPVGGGRGKVKLAAHPGIVAVAGRRGATPYEVALAWLLQASPAMFPIPGASRPESARSSARAAELVLGPDDLATLEMP
jgi:aryl-alcohol dehydrogenase-like predicted oxidoreductase